MVGMVVMVEMVEIVEMVVMVVTGMEKVKSLAPADLHFQISTKVNFQI